MLFKRRSRSSMAASTPGHAILWIASISAIRSALRILPVTARELELLGPFGHVLGLLPADQGGVILVGKRAAESRFHLQDHGGKQFARSRVLPSVSASFRSFSNRLRSSSLRLMRRENFWVSMTIPSMPEGTSSESFLTSSPARPKMACSSFSSGVSSVFDLGETLPTRMSPGRT